MVQSIPARGGISPAIRAGAMNSATIPQIDPADLLTDEELAARLKISVFSIKDMCRSRSHSPLPHFLVCHRRRFYWPDICIWLEKQQIK
jgi:hypothetical protein